MAKIQAIYRHKDYNSFIENPKSSLRPYEIVVDLPDNLTDDQIWNEANKESAKKIGYELSECNKI